MKARRKPEVVEVIKFDEKEWWRDREKDRGKYPMVKHWLISGELISCFYIDSPEGEKIISHGDYIIKGEKGEFYPCKPDIFHETYDILKDPIRLNLNGLSKELDELIHEERFSAVDHSLDIYKKMRYNEKLGEYEILPEDKN